jgi:putative ABC transport system permease protein
MRLERISIINIRKHFWRIGLLVLGLTVATATVVALYTLSTLMDRDFQNKLDEYGTNMVIVPKSDNLSLSYSGVPLGEFTVANETLTDNDVAKLKTIKNAENLAIIAPKIIDIAEIRGEEAIVVGVDFQEELKIKSWWRLGEGEEPAPSSNEALIGARAAQKFGLKAGEQIALRGERFTVVGILEPVGSQEDDPIYIDLKRAQSVFGRPEQLSMIEVAAWCADCPIEQIVGQTSEKLPNAKASAVVQAATARDDVVKQFTMFSVILSAVMAIVGGLIIFTTMLTAVRERRREIGIFRAVGFRRMNILEIILFETAFVALTAGLAGYLIGVLAAGLLAPSLGIILPVTLDITVGYFAVLGAILLTLVSSLYPALTAANLSPMIAINDI